MALQLLGSGIYQQRLAAYSKLEELLTPGESEPLGAQQRTLAPATRNALERIARDGRFPTEERGRAVRLLQRTGAAPRLRNELRGRG
jgi:hypothetical protein